MTGLPLSERLGLAALLVLWLVVIPVAIIGSAVLVLSRPPAAASSPIATTMRCPDPTFAGAYAPCAVVEDMDDA